MTSEKNIAVVILNWNGAALLERFLPSVLKYSDYPGVEIIVADNGSSDESLHVLNDKFPCVRTLLFETNHGFAGGYNEALMQLDHEFFILLNSDVEVTENWIYPVIEQLKCDENIAASMPVIRSLRNPDYFEYAGAAGGFIDILGYPFCRGRIMSELEKDNGQYNQPMEIFWATGACLFIRSRAFKEVGGFDSSFFAHMEEIDMCWRLKNKGYKILAVPSSKVFHLGGASLEYGHPRKAYFNFRNSLFMMYKNLPTLSFYKILTLRIPLDIVASLHLLLQGNGKACFAVYKAYWHFFLRKKKLSMTKMNLKAHAGVYHRSIIFDYYRGRKKFSQLKWK